MSAIATKLRKLRELYGYPQEYVAYQMGISQAAYSTKENGKTELSLTVLEQLAGLYQISMLDLIALSLPDLLILAIPKTIRANS